eukprot:scaffold31763_cov63-Phaeocystis_antarctica.AAC.2
MGMYSCYRLRAHVGYTGRSVVGRGRRWTDGCGLFRVRCHLYFILRLLFPHAHLTAHSSHLTKSTLTAHRVRRVTIGCINARPSELHTAGYRRIVDVVDARACVAERVEALLLQRCNHSYGDGVPVAFNVHSFHTAKRLGICGALDQLGLSSLRIDVEKIDVLQPTKCLAQRDTAMAKWATDHTIRLRPEPIHRKVVPDPFDVRSHRLHENGKPALRTAQRACSCHRADSPGCIAGTHFHDDKPTSNVGRCDCQHGICELKIFFVYQRKVDALRRVATQAVDCPAWHVGSIGCRVRVWNAVPVPWPHVSKPFSHILVR